ncbi:unnamed protein product, partial [Laminaria digitata]
VVGAGGGVVPGAVGVDGGHESLAGVRERLGGREESLAGAHESVTGACESLAGAHESLGGAAGLAVEDGAVGAREELSSSSLSASCSSLLEPSRARVGGRGGQEVAAVSAESDREDATGVYTPAASA